MGGNNMALAPRPLLRLSEIYRAGGTYAGVRVLPRPGSRPAGRPTRVPSSPATAMIPAAEQAPG